MRSNLTIARKKQTDVEYVLLPQLPVGQVLSVPGYVYLSGVSALRDPTTPELLNNSIIFNVRPGEKYKIPTVSKKNKHHYDPHRRRPVVKDQRCSSLFTPPSLLSSLPCSLQGRLALSQNQWL